MKKIAALLVLAAVLAAGALPVFAREKDAPAFIEQKNAVYADLGYTLSGLALDGFGIGASYERALFSRFSALASFGYIGFSAPDLEFKGFDIGLGLRVYPLASALGKLYIQASGVFSPIVIKSGGGEARNNIFSAGLSLGWKFMFGAGVFLEPYAGYSFGFNKLKLPPGLGSTDYKVSGFNYGIGLGWAF
jgi:hypothetical protein